MLVPLIQLALNVRDSNLPTPPHTDDCQPQSQNDHSNYQTQQGEMSLASTAPHVTGMTWEMIFTANH